MKVGDLVTAYGTRNASIIHGYLGVVIGFSDEGDPIVHWTHAVDGNTGPQTEYASHLFLLKTSGDYN